MESTTGTAESDAYEVSLCRGERIIYLREVAGEPIRELPGLWVSLDRVEYNPHEEGTPDRPYGFVYHITIHNDSPRVVTIKGRKWVVTNADNSKLVIEGDGVVGECPRLTPGTQFHYQSYHLIASDSESSPASRSSRWKCPRFNSNAALSPLCAAWPWRPGNRRFSFLALDDLRMRDTRAEFCGESSVVAPGGFCSGARFADLFFGPGGEDTRLI
jgi:ApaG protein